MLEADIKLKLNKLLSSGNDYFPQRLDKLLYNSARIILRQYKKEIPVDKGTARSDVQIYKNSTFNYTVTTKTTSNGVRYPELIHQGTYDYKNSPADYGRLNRSRMKGKYSFIDSRTGKKGIRPNKFADRAREISRPQVNEYLVKHIDNLLKER